MAKEGGHRSIIAATVALVAVLACGCNSGQDAAGDAVDHGGALVSEEGQIAFMRAASFDGPDIEADVYVIRADGSEERRLTDSPGLDGFPSWSPDGQRIAFASDRGGGSWELYTMSADGSGQRRLTNTQYHDESVPAFSPDEDKIAFATDIDSSPTVWVVDADGSDRERLASGLFPSWSPDGERIAFTAYAGERPYIAVMNADGSGRRSLGASLLQRLSGRVSDEQPAWSPDGQKIAFASEGDGELYAINPDGSGRTRLTDTPGYDHWPPTWSPDGTRIAFTSENANGSAIYVMNSDGSGLTKLTDGSAYDAFPAWRP